MALSSTSRNIYSSSNNIYMSTASGGVRGRKKK